ncbi:MAG TPA: YfiR family protein [Tepidisphaeraceae bacterium]|jgi:hypothetical protein|nr:YfiR family protein [Tepidisphaeraceae bacterium]
MRTRRSPAVVAWIIPALILAIQCRADAPTWEYQVKAAFIYNFTQFVEWPKSAFTDAKSPFVVATVGKDPFHGALEKAMDGKSVGSRAVSIRHFDDPDHMDICQILFVPASLDSSLSGVFNKVGAKPVLTVGETDAFCPAGGGIRFFIENDHMRLELNHDATDAAGLKISARLMSLAKPYKK